MEQQAFKALFSLISLWTNEAIKAIDDGSPSEAVRATALFSCAKSLNLAIQTIVLTEHRRKIE